MRYMTLAEFHERYGRDRRKPPAFWDGVLGGFGAMFAVDPPPLDPPRYPRDARNHDLGPHWRRHAMGGEASR